MAKVIDSVPKEKSSNVEKEQLSVIKNLKDKSVYYVKADKSNSVVILNKDDYDERVMDLIKECKYTETKRNPLKQMVRESNKLRQKIKTVFSERVSRSLVVSNPSIPKLYALPKTHKPGKKMRPIVSSVSAPTYKIAKWLVGELKKLPQLESMSVKNSFECVERVKGVKFNQDEILVSFDVCSLFPSIPVNKALEILEKHLESINCEAEKKSVYIETAKLCMKQNFFQFREKTYQVNFGTNMGNPLSPLIAELFMADFEMKLKKENLLPRVWIRYVDDVCAVVLKEQVPEILKMLNSRHESIKFTCEIEQDGKLPFLDLELQRVGNGIEFGVYHKPTSTRRTITSDSNCPIQHKMAAYHSMVHRLCRLPLSVANFKKEYEYILETARLNGYKAEMVDKIIYKHSKKVKKWELSTLFAQSITKEEKQRVSMTFAPKITNKFNKIFSEHDLEMVYRSDNKLKNLLGSTKDKTPELQKSGIYAVQCSECDKTYYGQTKRSIEERFKEHTQCIRLNQPNKSAIAAHVINEGHGVNKKSLKLLKQVNDDRRLDAYEAYYIQSNTNSLNLDSGNIESCLLRRAVNLK